MMQTENSISAPAQEMDPLTMDLLDARLLSTLTLLWTWSIRKHRIEMVRNISELLGRLIQMKTRQSPRKKKKERKKGKGWTHLERYKHYGQLDVMHISALLCFEQIMCHISGRQTFLYDGALHSDHLGLQAFAFSWKRKSYEKI